MKLPFLCHFLNRLEQNGRLITLSVGSPRGKWVEVDARCETIQGKATLTGRPCWGDERPSPSFSGLSHPSGGAPPRLWYKVTQSRPLRHLLWELLAGAQRTHCGGFLCISSFASLLACVLVPRSPWGSGVRVAMVSAGGELGAPSPAGRAGGLGWRGVPCMCWGRVVEAEEGSRRAVHTPAASRSHRVPTRALCPQWISGHVRSAWLGALLAPRVPCLSPF